MNDRYILGCKVNDISLEQALKMADTYLVSQKTHYIITPNPEICLKGYSDSELREIIKRADLALPDGFGLKIGARIQNQQLDNIITGVDFSYKLFETANKHGYKIVLIGGKGKSGTKALSNIRTQFPNIQADYLNGGIFNEKGESEYDDFIDRLNEARPDIILVNLGAPKQEYFIDRFKDSLNAQLIIGVGGTIDFLAGKIKRAPKFMRKLGIEWLWRLFQEPWRYKRIFRAVIVFPLACIWWRIRNAFLYRRSVVGMIINNEGKILLAKRKPRHGDKNMQDHWQLPQGGVDPGEDLDKAILREMEEEIGLKDLKIIATCKNCHKYNWPRMAKQFQAYKGQRQSIYLLHYEGNPKDVTIDDKEFQDYRWVDKHHIVELAHEYRKPLIRIGLDKFKDHL